MALGSFGAAARRISADPHNRVVMAAVRTTNGALTLAKRFEPRWMEDRQEATVQRSLQAVIQGECALTLMNAGSRRNLTDALIGRCG